MHISPLDGKLIVMSNISNTGSSIKCTVPGCFNNSTSVKQTPQEIWFYKFPEDEKIRQQWNNRCGKEDSFISDDCYVCFVHFAEDDFESLLERKLLPTAVPTLNLQRETEELQATLISPTNSEGASHDNLLNNQHVVIQTNDNDKLKGQISFFEEQLKIKSRQLTQLEDKVTDLNSQLDRERRENVRFEQALSYIFDPTKKHFVVNQKTKKEWNSDILESIMTIRHLSERCYSYFCAYLDYFLPDLESLRQWVSKIYFRQGLLKEVLCIMYVCARELNDQEKITVLQYGTMKVDSVHEYDKVNDEVFGPYSHMQVVIAAGLFASWKQPIYISFEKKISKNTLNVLINSLYEASYTVVACVSNYNKDIQDLWQEMGLNAKRSHFEHPLVGRKLYFFVETSQLLLNMRNILLDEGFTFNSGQKISVEPLRHLINSDQSQGTYSSKISERHLQCIEDDRCDLELASQLFSSDTAFDLKRMLPGPDKQLAYSTAVFIENISKWYKLTDQSYGLNLQEHNMTLTNMSNMISKLVVDENENVKVLQEAILMSINSLRSLHVDLWGRNKVVFNILPEKLSTNALGDLFTQISEGNRIKLTSPLKAVRQLQSIALNGNSDDKDEGVGDYLTQKFVSRITLPGDKNLLESKHESSTLLQSFSFKNESDGVLHLITAVAKKFKNTHPMLENILENAVIEGYSFEKSLVHPSEEWLTQARQLNKVFEKFHKNGLLTGQPKIIKHLTNMVSKLYPAIDLDVARCFLEQRLLLRIKFLNGGVDKRRKCSEG